MSNYNSQINAIRNATTHADVDAYYQGARQFFESVDDADFASHARDQAFRRLGPPAPAVRLEWAVAKLAA